MHKRRFGHEITFLGGMSTQLQVIDVMNAILTNNIQHHFPIVLKRVGSYVKRFTCWLDLQEVIRSMETEMTYMFNLRRGATK